MCYHNFSPLAVDKLHKPSFIWNNIMGAKEIFQKGILWRVRNGCNIRVYEDSWLPSTIDSMLQFAPLIATYSKLMVSDLIH